MDPFKKSRIGNTELELPQFGFGGGTLGDRGGVISEEQAEATLAAAYDSGVRYYDTAPWYGLGKSEHRIGHYLRQHPRSDFTLNTKVGRVLKRPHDLGTFVKLRWIGGLPYEVHFDYTRSGIERSYEDSLQRLGLNALDSFSNNLVTLTCSFTV